MHGRCMPSLKLNLKFLEYTRIHFLFDIWLVRDFQNCAPSPVFTKKNWIRPCHRYILHHTISHHPTPPLRKPMMILLNILNLELTMYSISAAVGETLPLSWLCTSTIAINSSTVYGTDNPTSSLTTGIDIVINLGRKLTTPMRKTRSRITKSINKSILDSLVVHVSMLPSSPACLCFGNAPSTTDNLTGKKAPS